LPGEFPLPCIILSNLVLFIKGFRGGFRRRGSSVDGPPGRKGVSEESAGECDGFCGKMKDERTADPRFPAGGAEECGHGRPASSRGISAAGFFLKSKKSE
jgi:hypothetical protein